MALVKSGRDSRLPRYQATKPVLEEGGVEEENEREGNVG